MWVSPEGTFPLLLISKVILRSFPSQTSTPSTEKLSNSNNTSNSEAGKIGTPFSS